ncbi:MAG: double-strand break repair protein AddB [Bdellovibrionales bacterium]|jgi:ATP-dependent helicase/nuclease subunit B
MSGVFTLPADSCFVTALARGLLARAGGDPMALAAMQIYLPTRRACRALREAFLQETDARASLLPRMQPLGDVEEDALDFMAAGALDDLPPAITPLRRQMLLTRLIAQKDAALPLDQAASLAAALAALLDQAQTTGCDLAQLKTLVPDNYAQHWQETLSFLEIVTAAWPKVLQEEGCVDPASRRAAVLDRQGKAWAALPPDVPIIAAGSTGSQPAVGRLMKTIASLAQGEVILPALDLSLPEDAWQAVGETHPQFTMKAWLDESGFAREGVRVWDDLSDKIAATPRVRLLQEAMRPAEVTESWQHLSAQEIPPEAVTGFEALTLDHAREEADVIALRLRAALEEAGKTAALVTPDRALAARVAAALTRWGIEVNDSAGASLDVLPVGRFLIDALKAASSNAGAIEFLTLLKHPLAALGQTPAQCRAFAQEAEVKLWRGVRRADVLTGKGKMSEDGAAWLARLRALLSPLSENWREKKSLAAWLDAHLALAEGLAQSESEAGAARLWCGEDGEAAVLALDDWRIASHDFMDVTGAEYLSLFEEIAHQVVVRPAYGQHPRLHVLGPLEARLLHYDLIILGGLNEGTWPPQAAIDPWLSRPMKKQLGLPLPERRIGLSAHDFAQLASAPQVMITRARRVGGAPAVPSRFWLQLGAVLQAAGYGEAALSPALPWRVWARGMDAPDTPPLAFEPPRPCPPLDARPKKLSVTEIGTWLSNPYAIYAKHILKLKKLDPIDADPSPSDFGTIVHAALEAFVKEEMANSQNVFPAVSPIVIPAKAGIPCVEKRKRDSRLRGSDGGELEENTDAFQATAFARLLAHGREAFAPFDDRPQVAAFWWPRFERLAAWFVENEKTRRAEGITPLAVEADGVMRVAGGALTLTGRADRLDRLAGGSAQIIDYKTGAAPSRTKVLAGYEPQLTLLALMAQAGAFDGQKAVDVADVAYWALQEKDESKKIVAFNKTLEAQCALAQEGLENLVRAFADPATPYEAVPRPHVAPRYDDYAHLARLAEGRGEQGDEPEGEAE